MKRIFVVCWFYPPINSSEGLVTYKLLNNSRYAYDVFTQESSADWSYGKNMRFQNGENVRSICGKSKDIADWKEEAFAYFKAHRGEYDCVMTRSMPQECHEVGLRIKRAFPEVKWIASFGDPVKDNPYQHLNCSLYSFHSMKNKVNRDAPRRYRLSPGRVLRAGVWSVRHRAAVRQRRALAALEDETLRLADKIILNNFSQQRYMLHGSALEQKAVVIRHSYDPRLYPPKRARAADGKTRFAFLGHLDEIRTAYPLLQAIKNLRDDKPDLPQRAEFLFYGEMGDADLLFLLKNDLLDMVRFCKPVAYLESLQEMQAADWLLHIDGNLRRVSDENIFFAAKVADYFGAQTNILAITMPNGDVGDVLRRAGELVLSFSANEIKQYLYLILYEGYQIQPDAAYIESFSSRRVAAEFDEKVIGALYGAETR